MELAGYVRRWNHNRVRLLFRIAFCFEKFAVHPPFIAPFFNSLRIIFGRHADVLLFHLYHSFLRFLRINTKTPFAIKGRKESVRGTTFFHGQTDARHSRVINGTSPAFAIFGFTKATPGRPSSLFRIGNLSAADSPLCMETKSVLFPFIVF